MMLRVLVVALLLLWEPVDAKKRPKPAAVAPKRRKTDVVPKKMKATKPKKKVVYEPPPPMDDNFWSDDDDESDYEETYEVPERSPILEKARPASRRPSRQREEVDDREDQAKKSVLYDAYNQLHTLAQAYDKPFDAPAVVVVGHQSSGKSALIEALMGFQFNQVGGGTKTRRPVALRMQYNPDCIEPQWFLVDEKTGVEHPRSLTEIQDFIERENTRLEMDPMKSFDSREINIRMEYRHCPNMILIDTPGLIAAPKVGKDAQDGAAVSQQRALQAAAREAERLVVDKMRHCDDYIILCVEDTCDWKHGPTRQVVQKADPELARTVIVNTKLDTKLPQFGNPTDVEDFIEGSVLDRLCPHKLGGPYFTSVPSGRVGRPDDDNPDYLYDTDEQFVRACRDSESNDRALIQHRLQRLGKGNSDDLLNKVGLKKLRTFLEEKVDECYKRNVRKIIPMLKSEYQLAEQKLKACDEELKALSIERLREGADAFCDEFCANLRKAMTGTIVAPVALYGETLDQETSVAGSFHAVNGSPMAVSDRTWEQLVVSEVGNQNHRLYGGSQYHRALREFQLATRCLRTPVITEDEIANAAGIGETHDGVNFLHAACVIALEKARVSFEPMLGALEMRLSHVMDRLCPVTEFMLREHRDRIKSRTSSRIRSDEMSVDGALDVSQNPQFRQLIRTIFEKFVHQSADSAMDRCRDDLDSMIRYVTWSLDERGSGALQRALPDNTDIVSVYQASVEAVEQEAKEADGEVKEKKGRKDKKDEIKTSKELTKPRSISNMPVGRRNVDEDYQNLIQLMEEAMMSRDASRTNLVVGGLVQHIVSTWREQFCKSVTTKFNCYFMLPFLDDFHKFIRKELQNIGEGDVFDVSAVRKSLQDHRVHLAAECEANKQLQEKFQLCASLMTIDPKKGLR